MDNNLEKTYFLSTFAYKLIYIFRINDNEHQGLLKIGDATIHTDKKPDELIDNCDELNNAAKKRIDSYTATAGTVYQLLHTELAINEKNCAFRDYDVHKVLKRSGIKQHFFDTNLKQNEWYEVNLQTAINAIKAAKSGKYSLNPNDFSNYNDPIVLRPEQEKAVKMTIDRFHVGDRMLWNAKMRFGKTLTALEVAKRMNFKKTIIITHRPVVSKGWFEDFKLIFGNSNDVLFGSKTHGESIINLIKSGKKFIYFASMQDLRGSVTVGGNFEKNDELFNIDWDFVVVDEAHEGTKTEHGVTTLSSIIKKDNNHVTKVLELSGTPFNLLNDYEENEIYTWDYVMEQEAKELWNKNHFGDSNPYEDLPKLNIYTYNLNKLIAGYEDVADKAFNFKEFFKTWTGDIEVDRKIMPESAHVGDFVHESDIKSFLNLISKKDEFSNYPYSRDDYRDYFRHSLWMLPGVKEARALSKLLKQHAVFGNFNIVNVAGDGDEETNYSDALKAVEEAFGPNPEDTYTITLSCGRLTTGVSVPEWTAVFMLSGTYSTAASNYLQTIFRVQTPAKIGGKIKKECYVFDFAPDRTLKMVAQAGQLSVRAGSTESRTLMGQFLNYCPVIAVSGSNMNPYDVTSMLQQLKKAYASKVVQNGFDDTKIYNDNLLKLDGLELEKFENLQKIIGASKQTKTVNVIDINKQGFTDEEYEKIEKLNKKPKKELTEEEKAALEELKKKKNQASKAISILRGISIRIPLLIYGADIDINKDIDCKNFVELIDDESWEEFMPRGVTKEMFEDFSKYYDQEIFIEAGRQIRSSTLYADTLSPEERVKKIADIFATFKNPDKETVLTPWKTVNMHMSDTIGGYSFFERDSQSGLFIPIDEPKYFTRGEATAHCLSSTAKILEMNSKTGLYPLYLTYSIYKQRSLNCDAKKLDEDLEKELWKRTLENNIYVLCKTKMAKSITKRTLAGYKDFTLNIISEQDIIEQFKNNSSKFIRKVNDPNTWKKEGVEMKFDAIVGNPPYQELVANNNGSVSQANPVYQLFVENATKLSSRYVSMITPSLWMTGGTGLNNFRKYMLEQNHITILHDYEVADKIFSNVAIAGGVSYFLWDRNSKEKTKDYYYRKDGSSSYVEVNMAENGTDIFIRDIVANNILKKVDVFNPNFDSFMELVSTYSPFANGVVGNYKDLYLKKPAEDTIKIYRFSRDKNDKFAYIKRKEIIARQEWIDMHKIFVSKAGEISARFNGLPFYGEPGTACNETYLVVGPFEDKETCMRVMKYMNTSLYKYLISQIKKTQNAARGVYKYVPNQDFTMSSDIDWSKDYYSIDKQIFEKYHLTDEEIQHIKNVVSPLEEKNEEDN